MLTPRTLSSILLIWALVLMASVVWKHEFITHTKAPRILMNETVPETDFAFDVPTEEEWDTLFSETSQGPANDYLIAIPLSKSLAVFDCPQASCKKIGAYPVGTELMIDIRTVRETDEWVRVPWPHPAAGPRKKYVSVAELEVSYAEPPPKPTDAINPEDLDLTPARPIAINPQTLVGIVCAFKSSDTLESTRITRGSGAIVTESGHILTARSVVDIGYLNEGLENYERTGCLIGQMPSKDLLPSIETIKKVNAFVRLPYLAYTASLAYSPAEEGLSDYEKAWLDFAVLKIDGVNPDARYFGGPTELPDEFPTTPLLISDLPKIGETTLNFAFPSGTTVGFYADIRTLFLQGLLSHVTGYWAGDSRYDNDLFLIETHLDTEDTAGGRFGSPIFWKGYVIGIHTAKQQGTRQIYNVGIKAVLENLFDAQYPLPLRVE